MAEWASSVIEMGKLVGPKIWKYMKYQTNPGSFVREWENEKPSLLGRCGRVEVEIQSQMMGIGKTEMAEVKDWLEKAKKATENDEDLFSKGGCFCNVCRARQFDERTLELKKLFADGEKYVLAGSVLVQDDHLKIKDHFMGEFQKLYGSLGDRKKDVQSTLYEQLRFGKTEKDEVKHWLEKVEKIIQTAQAEVNQQGGSLSHSLLAKLVREKIGEVKVLLDEGEKYTTAVAVLVKDDPSIIREHLLSKYEEMKGSLQSRKKDVESTLHYQLHYGKVARDEVKRWLRVVETLIQTAEDKISKGGCLSPTRLVPALEDKIGGLKELYDEGEKYTNDGAILVKVDPSIIRGVPLQAEKCYGRNDALMEIPKYLQGDGVARIAVWGMGGIGKTTLMKQIHNQFLKESQFDKVIWVTVSSELNVVRIQDDISKQFNKMSLEEEDAIKRAALISAMLAGGSYLLILDDVWGSFSAEKVGIPVNSGGKRLKLVLTTRTADVARQIDCNMIIKLEPLSPEEALQLFLDKVGFVVLSDDGNIKPALKSTLMQIVDECDGLPLAIVTVASRMKRMPDHQYSWAKALKQLRSGKIDVAGDKDPIMVTLRFSYDGLEDKKLQHCFLYCALFPEDFEIPKKEIIEYWIEEGFIDQMETRHEMICEGYAILRKLQDNCLLECFRNEDIDVYSDAYEGNYIRYIINLEDYEKVKMHDLVRDMALDITSKSPRFFVKASVSGEELRTEEGWAGDVEKVSLMENSYMGEIPLAQSHLKYNKLTTLLMPCTGISTIPESLFLQMPGLKVLDLSENHSLSTLPGSISDLENLTTLFLRHCRGLKKVPSLAKCQALTNLDLGFSGIKEVPDGMEMLVNMKYLNFYPTMIRRLPKGILSNMTNLQYLFVENVQIGEVVKLRMLEFLGVQQEVATLDELSILLEFMHKQAKRLRSLTLQGDAPYLIFHLDKDLTGRFIMSLNGIYICNLQFTVVSGGEDRGLSRINCILVALSMQSLILKGFENIDCFSGCWLNPLPFRALEVLKLGGLPNLKYVFDEEALGLLAPSFPLKKIVIRSCPELKKLFSPALLLNYLKNLSYIEITDCEKIEEIISSSKEEVLEKLTLPKLKSLKMKMLPALKSICDSSSVLICDSLKYLEIRGCKGIKRIPLYLPQLGVAPPSLKAIKIRPAKYWESLEWPQPNAKEVLLPICL